jgi:AAA ATPase domain
VTEFLFGREQELEALRARLRKPRSLLLYGPAGVGKTHLLKLALPDSPQSLYSPESAGIQSTFRNLALALPRAGGKGAEGIKSKSAVALRGIVIEALRKGKHFVVLDHLKVPSQAFAAAVREITDWGRTSVIAVARSPHMEDVGFLRPLFTERSDRFELRNLARPLAEQFAQECVSRIGLSAYNLREFLDRVLEFSQGNPGAILSMLQMAQHPQYRSAERIKITPLYVDFRLNWKTNAEAAAR